MRSTFNIDETNVTVAVDEVDNSNTKTSRVFHCSCLHNGLLVQLDYILLLLFQEYKTDSASADNVNSTSDVTWNILPQEGAPKQSRKKQKQRSLKSKCDNSKSEESSLSSSDPKSVNFVAECYYKTVTFNPQDFSERLRTLQGLSEASGNSDSIPGDNISSLEQSPAAFSPVHSDSSHQVI